MPGLSSYLESALLKGVFQNTPYAAPATLYISAHTADPGDTGANEVVGGSYARVAVTTGTAGTGAGAVFGGAPTIGTGSQSTKKATLSNGSAVTFPTATASWGTVGYVGVWDALTGGNFLMSGALTTGVAVNTGGQLTFPIGDLTPFQD